MDTLNQLPCPVLVTDPLGYIQTANHPMGALVGRAPDTLTHSALEQLLPLGARIFLQTHVWPVLRSQGHIADIPLRLLAADGAEIRRTLACQRGHFAGAEAYYWVLSTAPDLRQFEEELQRARLQADGIARELAESARFIKTITDAMPSLVAYWDKDLRCHFANKPYTDWFGIPPEEIIGSTMPDMLGPKLFALNQGNVRAVLAGQAQQFERSLTKFDGSTRYTLAHYVPDVGAADEVVGFFVLINDVTYLKAAESELKLAASVFSSTVDGIMVMEADGTILSINPAFTTITGYTSEEVVGQPPRMLQSMHHDPAFYNAIVETLKQHGHWSGELWNRRKDGESFLEWQTITAVPGSGDTPMRYVAVFNDITERWHKDVRIRHLALHDPLTDLPNRELLTERLAQLLAKTEREPRQLALLFLDLDQFKHVNDTLGHGIGDQLLVQVAQRLLTLVRQTDTVARLGGDEFVILLDNPLNQAYVAQIAARIVDTLHAPMEIQGKMAQVGTSIGIAMYPGGGRDPATLIKNADAAMYAAKHAGRNTYCFFTAAA